MRQRNASSIGLQLRGMQLHNYNKNFLLEPSLSNPCAKKQPLWPVGRQGSQLCRGRATFFLQQLPLFVRKLSQSRVHLRSLAASRWRRQRSKMWSVYSFRKVMAAPQSPPGAAGSVGHPWAHRLPGAGPVLALARLRARPLRWHIPEAWSAPGIAILLKYKVAYKDFMN